MVRASRFILLSVFCLGAGLLLFMVQRNWLLIHVTCSPFTTSAHASMSIQMPAGPTQQKTITISYPKNGNWINEQATILWHAEDTSLTLKHLIKQWLQVLQDAHLINPHLAVTTVAVTPTSGEAFISFDSPLLQKDCSLHAKWLIVESLCRTIRTNELTVSSLMLLQADRSMPDDHFDFSHPISLENRL